MPCPYCICPRLNIYSFVKCTMSLKRIEKNVLAGKRLKPEDALALFESEDIFTIGRLANTVAERKNGNTAYFVQNHHINPTNICVNRCTFCAFSRSKGGKGAYELTIKQIINKLRKHIGARHAVPSHNHSTSFSEVHIVGGLHPDWGIDFYLDMLGSIKKNFPDLHIKAFTAVEIEDLSNISGLSLRKTLTALQEAGLESMPGGGA